MWNEWEKAGLLDRILSFGGGFEPRFVRGSTTTLSNHSFGFRHSTSMWRGTSEAIVRRSSARKARCAARSHRPQMGILVGRPFQHARRHAFRGGRTEIVLLAEARFSPPLPPNLLGTKPLQGLLKGPITPTLLSE